MLEQGSQRRQLSANGGAGQRFFLQGFAPGQNMGPGDGPKILRPIDADKLHEAAQVIFIGAPRLRIIDIGEPFDRRRHIAQLVILRGGQNRDFRCQPKFRKDPCFGVLE